MSGFTHFDEKGASRMVDVTEKNVTDRVALAMGTVRMKPETLKLITEQGIKKGNVFEVARLAGIMAVKQTPHLIPLCHPLMVSGVTVDFETDFEKSEVEIAVEVRVGGQTGVEMEALTGVSVTALTIYDMCKAVDKEMEITNIRLMRKSGGKSGLFVRGE